MLNIIHNRSPPFPALAKPTSIRLAVKLIIGKLIHSFHPTDVGWKPLCYLLYSPPPLQPEPALSSLSTTAIVLDDHPLVARGIADFLGSACAVDSALALSTPAELWSQLNRGGPAAVLIIDFWLTDGASIPLIQQLKQRYSFPILVISADDNQAVLQKIQSLGADGFLHKQESPQVFQNAVNALLAGKTWFERPTHLTGATFPREVPVTAQELGLTTRQGEILALLLQALPNKRIAKALSISEQTVKEHVTAILEKLGARNRMEVITQFRGKKLQLPDSSST